VIAVDAYIEQANHIRFIRMRANDQHFQIGILHLDLPHCADRLEVGHRHIDDKKIDRVTGQRLDQIGAGAHFGNHFQIGQLQQGVPQAGAHNLMIVSQNDTCR